MLRHYKWKLFLIYVFKLSFKLLLRKKIFILSEIKFEQQKIVNKYTLLSLA